MMPELTKSDVITAGATHQVLIQDEFERMQMKSRPSGRLFFVRVSASLGQAVHSSGASLIAASAVMDVSVQDRPIYNVSFLVLCVVWDGV